MPIENMGHWCGMQSEQVTVDISSERDSPIIKVTIEEEVSSMSMRSSLVLKKKRRAQQTATAILKKQETKTSMRTQEEAPTQMGPSSLGVVESIEHIGVPVMDFLLYFPPTWPDAKPRKMTKNHKYPMKMTTIP